MRSDDATQHVVTAGFRHRERRQGLWLATRMARGRIPQRVEHLPGRGVLSMRRPCYWSRITFASAHGSHACPSQEQHDRQSRPAVMGTPDAPALLAFVNTLAVPPGGWQRVAYVCLLPWCGTLRAARAPQAA